MCFLFCIVYHHHTLTTCHPSPPHFLTHRRCLPSPTLPDSPSHPFHRTSPITSAFSPPLPLLNLSDLSLFDESLFDVSLFDVSLFDVSLFDLSLFDACLAAVFAVWCGDP